MLDTVATGRNVPLQGTPADYQVAVRSTLDWIPLREGVDYSVDPPLDNNPAGATPELLPPCVWAPDYVWTGDATGVQHTASPVDKLGVSVSVPNREWGVHLSGSPNHALADGHGVTKSDHYPLIDYRELVATIAFESDQRFTLEVAMPGASASDGVLEVEAPGAECWYLAPNTVVGAALAAVQSGFTSAGPKIKTSGNFGRLLRNDLATLELVMASTLSRYITGRARAEIIVKGLKPWTGLVGQVLTYVQEGGTTHAVHSPITSVQWRLSEQGGPETVILAGFAL